MFRNRRFLVALAVVLPLALFGVAKITTRFRPVAIGELARTKRSYSNGEGVRVGADCVVAGGGPFAWTRFSFPSDTRRVLAHETILEDSAFTLKLRPQKAGDSAQVRVSDEKGASVAYDVPDTFVPAYHPVMDDNTEAHSFTRQTARLSPDGQRLELMLDGVYCRWNRGNPKPTRVADILHNGGLNGYETMGPQSWAIARDGESVVLPTIEEFSRFSTRTAKRTARLKLATFRGFKGYSDFPRLSSFGTYALYRMQPFGGKAMTYCFDTTRARPLWQAQSKSVGSAYAFARDEQTIAIAQDARALWEIRDVRSGQVLRTLPLASGTQAAEFSTDGATLYSLANGKLIRQRAR